MRIAAALLALVGAAQAGPKGIEFLPSADAARERARTRGRLIFLTVVVDHDNENRAVMDTVLRDAKLLKVLEEFACLLANPENQHGGVRIKLPDGKTELRCADAPAIECRHHLLLAQDYARGFYGDKPVKTPIHFVLDADENVLDMIFTGDFEQGLHSTPADELVKRLDALLKKHGRGLTEAAYAKMLKDLENARAARARGLFPEEIKALLAVLALEKEIEGVRAARARMKEIEGVAGAELAKAEALAAGGQWEEALDALVQVRTSFPGTLTAQASQKGETELRGDAAVRKEIAARDLFLAGKAFLDKKRPEMAQKKFEECVRRFPGTKYAGRAESELAASRGD
ncbi:MAG: tetratricopeptide repeat protein [Planctomycetaceae bacterium]